MMILGKAIYNQAVFAFSVKAVPICHRTSCGTCLAKVWIGMTGASIAILVHSRRGLGGDVLAAAFAAPREIVALGGSRSPTSARSRVWTHLMPSWSRWDPNRLTSRRSYLDRPHRTVVSCSA